MSDWRHERWHRRALALALALATLALTACSQSKGEPTPEQLIEQQPSGAGSQGNEWEEPRPGYFKKF